MNWGKAFSILRDKVGKKQGEMARIIGISQDSLSQIELGKKKPKPETVKKFANAVGLDVNYIELLAILVNMTSEQKEKLNGFLKPGLQDKIFELI